VLWQAQSTCHHIPIEEIHTVGFVHSHIAGVLCTGESSLFGEQVVEHEEKEEEQEWSGERQRKNKYTHTCTPDNTRVHIR
jgi:hypothetical protein